MRVYHAFISFDSFMGSPSGIKHSSCHSKIAATQIWHNWALAKCLWSYSVVAMIDNSRLFLSAPFCHHIVRDVFSIEDTTRVGLLQSSKSCNCGIRIINNIILSPILYYTVTCPCLRGSNICYFASIIHNPCRWHHPQTSTTKQIWLARSIAFDAVVKTSQTTISIIMHDMSLLAA